MLLGPSLKITPPIVWGNLLHILMQACLEQQRWDQQFLDLKISEVVKANLELLLSIKVTEEKATRNLKVRTAGFEDFANRYLTQIPLETARLTQPSNNLTSPLAITNVFCVEEEIWSSTYGLKGKVDASVSTLVGEVGSTSDRGHCPRSTELVTKPLEIKTGSSAGGLAHRAQTLLYTLLMSERYMEDIPSGLLYYTQSKEVISVPVSRPDIRALLMARNEIAEYVMRRMGGERKGAIQSKATQVHDIPNSLPEVDIEDCVPEATAFSDKSILPPLCEDSRVCGTCNVLDACMIYRRAAERVIDDSSPISHVYNNKTGHITPAQAAFFRVWEPLLSLEEREAMRHHQEIWTPSEGQTKSGRFPTQLIIDTQWRADDNLDVKRRNKYSYAFRFVRCSEDLAQESLFLNGETSLGDNVIISSASNLLAIARGSILDLTSNEIILGVNRDLVADNTRFRHQLGSRMGHGSGCDRTVATYRIDKELFGGITHLRRNLVQLFHPDTDARFRESIVDLKPPRFNSMVDCISIAAFILHLNNRQQQAIQRVLSAHDYALILGTPGTGKSTVIVAMIMSLIRMHKTVLLTSYTHSAIDTILLRLQDQADFKILRLGNLDKVGWQHPR
ncbi:hypothetical protein EIP86_002452 [Pleurotus ostreatoroseus]|nr:hypothetical protein EIP86_002452 [Pleurotus ostreatoroseus]